MAFSLPDGTVASWAVAAGTLILAIVTYYQARLLVKERKVNEDRELIEKIYVPLSREAAEWLEPDNYQMLNSQTLEREFPHLLPKLPTELLTLLTDMKQIVPRLSVLSFDVNDLISKASKTVAEKMGLHSKVVGGSGWTTFGILRGTEGLFAISLKDLWLSGKSLPTYSTQEAEKRWPGMEWTLDLRIDSQPVAGQKEALDFASQALDFLVHPPSAREYREKIQKKQELAGKALSIIKKKMGIKKPGRWSRIRSRFRR